MTASNDQAPDAGAVPDRLPAPDLPGADLGRVAYEAESAWLNEFAPGRHTPWDALDPEVREVYRRLAASVAAAVQARAEAAEAKLAAIEPHLPVALDALKTAIASGGYEYERKRYKAALEALESSEGEACHG